MHWSGDTLIPVYIMTLARRMVHIRVALTPFRVFRFKFIKRSLRSGGKSWGAEAEADPFCAVYAGGWSPASVAGVRSTWVGAMLSGDDEVFGNNDLRVSPPGRLSVSSLGLLSS